MREFIHVHLIDKQPVGTNLGRHIPLHMTVLHWFESRCDIHEIVESTEIALNRLGPIVVSATKEDLFGPDNDVPVMRLERDSRLLQLHMNLKRGMEDLGAEFDTKWTGEARWNPHVSHKEDSRLLPGDQVRIDDIDLITRTGKDGDRMILRRFQLSDETIENY